ncbi:MAG: cysteine dioxygenase family protein [Desulfobacteraceae bacterium]|nr:cysteine dioxygenase family protein [Desulfobacteraceae bacterium]
MTAWSKMPPALRKICESWSDELEKISGYEERLAYVRRMMPDLLLDAPIFTEILRNATDGSEYPDTRRSGMFDNELLLYIDPKRIFSIRLYLWAPGEYTPIHDHNAWGVIGPVAGKLQVTKYVREDAGSDENFARLKEAENRVLTAGQTEVVLPLNNGIHKTGNPGNMTSATVQLYGNPIRRTYINRFDPVSGRIGRIYPPRTKMRILASEALRAMHESSRVEAPEALGPATDSQRGNRPAD